jgi:LAGLIDADG-like domain
MKDSAFRIRFNSEQMTKDLCVNFNITPAKTHTYTMPLFEEDYLMLEFLRGYIEGDGHLSKKASGRVALSLCSANESFLLEFKEICELLLNKSITQEVTLSTNPKGQVFNIVFTLDDSDKLINLLYKNSTVNTRLDRKYSIASLVIR